MKKFDVTKFTSVAACDSMIAALKKRLHIAHGKKYQAERSLKKYGKDVHGLAGELSQVEILLKEIESGLVNPADESIRILLLEKQKAFIYRKKALAVRAGKYDVQRTLMIDVEKGGMEVVIAYNLARIAEVEAWKESLIARDNQGKDDTKL